MMTITFWSGNSFGHSAVLKNQFIILKSYCEKSEKVFQAFVFYNFITVGCCECRPRSHRIAQTWARLWQRNQNRNCRRPGRQNRNEQPELMFIFELWGVQKWIGVRVCFKEYNWNSAFPELAELLLLWMQIINFMKTLIAVILWCILFVLCWPIALVLIFILPIVWLILLPFRIIGFTLEVVFKLIGAILLFPFKLVKALWEFLISWSATRFCYLWNASAFQK